MPKSNVHPANIMALAILTYSVSEPATVYIHYTSVLCRWLVRNLHCIEEIVYIWPIAICTVAMYKKLWITIVLVRTRFIIPGFCYCWFLVVIVVLFFFFCYCFPLFISCYFKSGCNLLLCSIRINWKYTTYGHFTVGDGLITLLHLWGAASSHLDFFP